MEKTLSILVDYLTQNELSVINDSITDRGIDIDFIENVISPLRAKYISDILFINRKELLENEVAKELFTALNRFYDNNSISELMIGDGALVPDGMCDLNNEESYVYESQY